MSRAPAMRPRGGAVDPTRRPGRRRVRARVEGVVQGVGFRPHVYRLAVTLGLGGHVRNDVRGVVVEVEGDAGAVERFLDRLVAEAPPLASIERVLRDDIAPAGERSFSILESAAAGEPSALVSPDTATCAACLGELFDPGDRRYRYPFINCTDCGPRFTIVRGVPYDRPLTTMAGFTMCAWCRAEYDDPGARRFHAQPNACAACGPSVRLVDALGHPASRNAPNGDDAIATAARALAGGAIIAVKGLGGYHLACRADHESAVARLRSRKHREDRPFALMVPDVGSARALADLAPEDEALLTGPARPIVLCRRLAAGQDRRVGAVAPSVAPGSRDLGLMLPYTPLHHLLVADAGVPLVMTSGNVSDEPIAYRDDDALARLGTIADLFLTHDRPIQTRTDDSVIRTVAVGASVRPLVVRRSRGHVPASLALPDEAPPLLACGAELKSTFCVGKGRRAWVSHHIGDLKNYETLAAFREGVAQFERLFAARPEVVAHDLHPDYLSTAYALERQSVRHVAVQHHHAHLAACLAEHGMRGPAISAIFDGAGYGPDGTVWGGELLFGDLTGFERCGHLWPVRLPGGDRAAREPWRMACAWLAEAEGGAPALPCALQDRVEPRRWRAVTQMALGGLAAPLTTSAGRLFDAIAAIAGVRAEVTYEGQAAIELEALADPIEESGYTVPLVEAAANATLQLDVREAVLAAARDAAALVPSPVISARFHNGLAEATSAALSYMARARGCDVVVLSGGVFQNRLLLERTAAPLSAAGFTVLVPERLPPNDGGIAYGQAAVAAALHAAATGASR
ncbi:MAG TPA: carbamoyltransferase HypF [Gemmatimonadales bacterium]|nr:carbamoyltransferase HypF [Gemmatimonadales bacterium]